MNVVETEWGHGSLLCMHRLTTPRKENADEENRDTNSEQRRKRNCHFRSPLTNGGLRVVIRPGPGPPLFCVFSLLFRHNTLSSHTRHSLTRIFHRSSASSSAAADAAAGALGHHISGPRSWCESESRHAAPARGKKGEKEERGRTGEIRARNVSRSRTDTY